jgi:hypothetical protein
VLDTPANICRRSITSTDRCSATLPSLGNVYRSPSPLASYPCLRQTRSAAQDSATLPCRHLSLRSSADSHHGHAGVPDTLLSTSQQIACGAFTEEPSTQGALASHPPQTHLGPFPTQCRPPPRCHCGADMLVDPPTLAVLEMAFTGTTKSRESLARYISKAGVARAKFSDPRRG